MNNAVLWKELRVRLRGKGGLTAFTSYSFFMALAVFLIYVAIPADKDGGARYLQVNTEGSLSALSGFIVLQALALFLIIPATLVGGYSGEVERKTDKFLLSLPVPFQHLLYAKLASSFLYGLMFLVAGLPLAGMLLWAGGVRAIDFLHAHLVLLIYLMPLSAFALYQSCVRGKTATATAIFYLCAAAYFGTGFLSSIAFLVQKNVSQSALLAFLPPVALILAMQGEMLSFFGASVPVCVPALYTSLPLTLFFLAGCRESTERAGKENLWQTRAAFFLAAILADLLVSDGFSTSATNSDERIFMSFFAPVVFSMYALVNYALSSKGLSSRRVSIFKLFVNAPETSLVYVPVLTGTAAFFSVMQSASSSGDWASLTMVHVATSVTSAFFWTALALFLRALISGRVAMFSVYFFIMGFIVIGSVIPGFPHHVVDSQDVIPAHSFGWFLLLFHPVVVAAGAGLTVNKMVASPGAFWAAAQWVNLIAGALCVLFMELILQKKKTFPAPETE